MSRAKAAKEQAWWRWGLGLLLGLGAALRLRVALTAPWYWDEGYFVELAKRLSLFERPRAGALWEDGFFPLSTSHLPTASAAPVVWLTGGGDPMLAGRLWAVGLSLAAVWLTALAGRRLWGAAAGLTAAAAFALHPFAVEFGGRAFYHHFAVFWLLLAFYQGLRAREEGRGQDGAALALGMAVASAYWLWWSPLPVALFVAGLRPLKLVRFLALAGIFPLAAVALNFWPDPAGAVWSAKTLFKAALTSPPDLPALLGSLAKNLKVFPFLAAGSLGLLLGLWRAPAGRWLAAGLGLLTLLEPVRQRGDITGMPYPFLLALPYTYLGLANLAWGAPRPRWRPVFLAAGLAVALWPVNLDTLRMWSLDQRHSREWAAYLRGASAPGQAVLGMANVNWLLHPQPLAADPFNVPLSEGKAAAYFIPGAPPSRLAFPSRLQDLRFLSICRIHFLGFMHYEGVGVVYLQAEKEGWPLVWSNPGFKVYENPRFGAKKDPGVRILEAPESYEAARQDAVREGRPDLASLASARLARAAR